MVLTVVYLGFPACKACFSVPSSLRDSAPKIHSSRGTNKPGLCCCEVAVLHFDEGPFVDVFLGYSFHLLNEPSIHHVHGISLPLVNVARLLFHGFWTVISKAFMIRL